MKEFEKFFIETENGFEVWSNELWAQNIGKVYRETVVDTYDAEGNITYNHIYARRFIDLDRNMTVWDFDKRVFYKFHQWLVLNN